MRVLGGFVVAMAMAATAHATDMPNTNLSCTGDQLYSAGKFQKFSDWKQTYRIDYEAKRWCEGFCTETFPIYNITEKFLMLRWEGTNNDNILIDRVAARAQGYKKLNAPDRPLVAESFSGDCTPEPFTGLKAKPQF